MNGLPYYKAYPRDFLEGTIGMSFEVKGAYRLILDLIYMQGGKLPDDARYISGNLGCSVRRWNAIRAELIDLGKIHAIGEFLVNYRADKELESLGKLQEKQRENARRPNKNKDIEKPRRNHTEPEPEVKEREDKSSLKKTAKRKTRIPEDAVLSDKFREIAIGEGLSPQEAEAQFLKFKDNNLANGRTYVDWSAAWRNWLRSPYFRPLTNIHPIRKGQGYAERLDDLYREASAALSSNPF